MDFKKITELVFEKEATLHLLLILNDNLRFSLSSKLKVILLL